MSETKDVKGDIIVTGVKWGVIGVFAFVAIRLINEGINKSMENLQSIITQPIEFLEDAAGNIADGLGDVGDTISDTVDNIIDTTTKTTKAIVQTKDALIATVDVLNYSGSQDYNLGPQSTVFKVLYNAGNSSVAKVANDLKNAVDIGKVWDAYEARKQALLGGG